MVVSRGKVTLAGIDLASSVPNLISNNPASTHYSCAAAHFRHGRRKIGKEVYRSRLKLTDALMNLVVDRGVLIRKFRVPVDNRDLTFGPSHD